MLAGQNENTPVIADLTDKDFKFLQNLVYDETGIVIGDHKRQMIYRRLVKRVKELKINDLKSYCSILRNRHNDEMMNFINAVTTNLTSFFREKHHFEFLSEEFLPKLIQSENRRLRIWSSASSTGEEPYSIAITMLEGLEGHLSNIDAKILATDLDTQVLTTAKRGEYKYDRISDLPPQMINKWFNKLDNTENYKAIPTLRQHITFNQLNLLGQWPMSGLFDVIFCRNVLIYFDTDTQKKMVQRFYDTLQPNGILMLGHSESVLKGSKEFANLGKTIYQKVDR